MVVYGDYERKREGYIGEVMREAYETPIIKCPYCGFECEADFVDVGVGMVQCGPYHCERCYASEIGQYDTPRDLTDAEELTGWYEPYSPPGSSANVINGKIVGHKKMYETYREEFTNNPLWNDKDYVNFWLENIREKSDVSES